MKAIALLTTLGDREEMLAQCVAAWANVAGADLRVITGMPVGAAVDYAYRDIEDDEIAFPVCDDTVPMITDLDKVLEVYHRMEQPAPRYLKVTAEPWAPYDGDPDGSPSNWTRMPVASGRLYREIGPALPVTSYYDFDYSARLSVAGWKHRLCHAFTFVHLDGPHDWETPEMHAHEEAVYRAAQAVTDGLRLG